MPRSRGAASGILLVLLGVAAALAPLLGPEIGLTIGSKKTFDLTQDRLLLSVLPGAAVAIGGLMLLLAANRPVALMGGFLALAGGIWLIVGPLVSRLWEDSGGLLGAAGAPAGTRSRQTLEILVYFHGIGAIITALAGIALGRLAIKAASDVRDERHRPARERDVEPPRRREPVVEEPPHGREPVVDEPAHRREPVVDEPAHRREPLVDEPPHRREQVVDEPAHRREPVVEEPAHRREPVVDEPPRREPVVDEPPTRAVEPGATEPPRSEPDHEQRTEVRPADPPAAESEGRPRRSGGIVDRMRDRFS